MNISSSLRTWILLGILLLAGAGALAAALIQAPNRPTPTGTASSSASVSVPATNTIPEASSTESTTTTIISKEVKADIPPAPIKKPVPVAPIPTPVQTTTTVTTTITPPAPSAPPASSFPVTNTLKVSPIALLGGGTARLGATIPVSYLQVINQSTSTVSIKGFTVRQQGTTPDTGVIGFSSVDDKSGSRGAVGGTEGSNVLQGNVGYIPSTAVIAPGQMKLFTLKAQLSSLSQYAGTSLTLVVTGVDSPLQLTAQLPIPGTTWNLAP